MSAVATAVAVTLVVVGVANLWRTERERRNERERRTAPRSTADDFYAWSVEMAEVDGRAAS